MSNKDIQRAAAKLSKALASRSGRYAYVLIVSDMGDGAQRMNGMTRAAGDGSMLHAVAAGMSEDHVLAALKTEYDFFYTDRVALKALCTPAR